VASFQCARSNWLQLRVLLPCGFAGASSAHSTSSVKAGALDTNDVVLAQGLADVATIAILQHQTSIDARVLNSQLSSALNSRIIIEQAKGMISQATNCDMDVAFSRLRAHARNHNERLTALANAIVGGRFDLRTWTVRRHDETVIETSRYACNATLPVRPMRNSSVNDDGEYGPSPHYRIRSGAPDDVRVNHEVVSRIMN